MRHSPLGGGRRPRGPNTSSCHRTPRRARRQTPVRPTAGPGPSAPAPGAGPWPCGLSHLPGILRVWRNTSDDPCVWTERDGRSRRRPGPPATADGPLTRTPVRGVMGRWRTCVRLDRRGARRDGPGRGAGRHRSAPPGRRPAGSAPAAGRTRHTGRPGAPVPTTPHPRGRDPVPPDASHARRVRNRGRSDPSERRRSAPAGRPRGAGGRTPRRSDPALGRCRGSPPRHPRSRPGGGRPRSPRRLRRRTRGHVVVHRPAARSLRRSPACGGAARRRGRR